MAAMQEHHGRVRSRVWKIRHHKALVSMLTAWVNSRRQRMRRAQVLLARVTGSLVTEENSLQLCHPHQQWPRILMNPPVQIYVCIIKEKDCNAFYHNGLSLSPSCWLTSVCVGEQSLGDTVLPVLTRWTRAVGNLADKGANSGTEDKGSVTAVHNKGESGCRHGCSLRKHRSYFTSIHQGGAHVTV